VLTPEQAAFRLSRSVRSRAIASRQQRAATITVVAVRGLRRLKFGELRACLRAVGIDTRRVPEVAYVGRSLVEFYVDNDYVAELQRLVSAFDGITIDENYDPLAPSPTPGSCQPASDSDIARSYARRLVSLSANARSAALREFFAQRLQSLYDRFPLEVKDARLAACNAQPPALVAASGGSDPAMDVDPVRT